MDNRTEQHLAMNLYCQECEQKIKLLENSKRQLARTNIDLAINNRILKTRLIHVQRALNQDD